MSVSFVPKVRGGYAPSTPAYTLDYASGTVKGSCRINVGSKAVHAGLASGTRTGESRVFVDVGLGEIGVEYSGGIRR